MSTIQQILFQMNEFNVYMFALEIKLNTVKYTFAITYIRV